MHAKEHAEINTEMNTKIHASCSFLESQGISPVFFGSHTAYIYIYIYTWFLFYAQGWKSLYLYTFFGYLYLKSCNSIYGL